jgi:ribosomal protein S18 acetylase RimI-like enzyme
MADARRVVFRFANAADTNAVATLHADSWQRHYRGIYSDAYLDNEVFADRWDEWTRRLAEPDPHARTIVAEEDAVPVGFVHVIFDDDERWGSLIDNLHVTFDRKRSGIGRQLMARAAASAHEHATVPGVFLWVLEENTAAQSFYAACGGTCVERQAEEAPGGGTIIGLRYVWPDASQLL